MMLAVLLLLCSSSASALAPPFPSSRIRLNGVQHYVRDTGDPSPSAPIAILLHGFTGSTDSWEDIAPLLKEGGVRAVAIDRVGFGRTERPRPPTFPAPPPLPGRELLAGGIESLIADSSASGLQALIPDPLAALATALRRPTTLAPRLPWQLSTIGRDPYSSTFAVSALSPLIKSLVAATSGERRRVYFVGHSAGGPLALRALCNAVADSSFLPPRVDVGGVCLVAGAVLDPQVICIVKCMCIT
jgi:pimeloyl-ACP methyl ester carboxylesterase